jgi:hypothetical protein
LSFHLLSKKINSKSLIIIILPVVVYGCGNWSLASSEEYKPRVFHNKVLRKISGAKREEATGEWSKLHNKEL